MTKIKDFFKHIGKKFKQNWRKILLWLVLLVFAACGMVYSWMRKNKGDIVSGSADTSSTYYDFEGSNLYWYNLASSINSNTVVYNFNQYISSCSFSFERDSLGNLLCYPYLTRSAGAVGFALYTVVQSSSDYLYTLVGYYNSFSSFEFSSNKLYCVVFYSGSVGVASFYMLRTPDFLLQPVSKVDFNHIYTPVSFDIEYASNQLTYYSSSVENNSQYCRIFSPCIRVSYDNSTSSRLSGIWDYRSYYIGDFNDTYYNGYNDGFSAGEQDKQDAVNEAFTTGKNAGYNLAMETLNNNGAPTFLSLIDAVGYGVTKPFVSLLNFDLLGVNMLDFATSILTIFIVVKIITLFV